MLKVLHHNDVESPWPKVQARSNTLTSVSFEHVLLYIEKVVDIEVTLPRCEFEHVPLYTILERIRNLKPIQTLQLETLDQCNDVHFIERFIDIDKG